MTAGRASTEWRKHYMVPIAAGVGYIGASIHIFGFGAFIKPISAELGWSRTLTTAGISIANVIMATGMIPMGLLLDRIGSRPFALVGILLTAVAFSLLGTATGAAGNWYLLWVMMGLAVLPIQATVWTSGVATRFEASRGLAFGVTMVGASVGTALFPYLGTRLTAVLGWRMALVTQAGLWLLVAFPMVFFFFRPEPDRLLGNQIPHEQIQAAAVSGVGFLEGLRTTIYIRLLVASLLLMVTMLSLQVHFIPILMDGGFTATAAAGIASLIGIGAIAGRLGTGILLDRCRASMVGAIAFLLPAAGCYVMVATGYSPSGALVAAFLIGLTVGAEVDVTAYLTSRYFGRKSFGALFGGLLAAMMIGAAAGPVAAARIFDSYGSYNSVLWLAIGFMLASSLALASLPHPKLVGATS